MDRGVRGRATTGLSCNTRRKGQGGARAQLPGDRGRSHAVQKAGKPHSLKNQIRDIERLLHKPDLDPRARSKQVTVLKALQAALAKHQRAELERKYAVRYHKIRFFERVKLERQIRHVQKAMAIGMDSSESKARLAHLHEDLQYILHFPRGEKYVSVMKQAESAEAQAVLDAERSRLRAMVSQRLAEAAMLAEPDEGISLPADSARAPADGTALSGNAPDEFFLQESDSEVGTARHGSSHLLAKFSSEPKRSGSEGPISKRKEPLGKREAVAAKKQRLQGSHLQQPRLHAKQGHNAVEAERPCSELLPAMPQPHGTSGRLCLGPARHDQKWLADGRVSRAEDGTARGAHTASGNCRWQGKQITKSAHTPAASNGALSSAPRAGPLFQAESAGRVSAGLVAAARESADKLPLRMRADGGRKRRKRSQ